MQDAVNEPSEQKDKRQMSAVAKAQNEVNKARRLVAQDPSNEDWRQMLTIAAARLDIAKHPDNPAKREMC